MARMIRLLFASLLLAAPLAAQEAERKPGAERSREIIREPLRDLRIADREIPPELEAIGDTPYAIRPRNCAAIAAAVRELDRVLGEDVDAPGSAGELNGRADVALTAAEVRMDTLIPGRGLIRRLTGADKARKRYNTAIQAGVIRRGYLKGLGAARGCKPPAAPR